MERRSFVAGLISSPLYAALWQPTATVDTQPPVLASAVPGPKARLSLKINTTGLDPQYGHHIYEIAALIIDDNCVVGQRLHQYLRPPVDTGPGRPAYGAPPWFLRDNATFRDIAHGFVDHLRGAHIVVHNARFELEFLDHELMRAGLKPLKNYWASITDTMVTARELFGRGVRCGSLDALCQHVGIAAPNAEIYRSGLEYAKVVGELYILLKQARHVSAGALS